MPGPAATPLPYGKMALLQADVHPFPYHHGFGGPAWDLSLTFNNIILFGRHELPKHDI